MQSNNNMLDCYKCVLRTYAHTTMLTIHCNSAEIYKTYYVNCTAVVSIVCRLNFLKSCNFVVILSSCFHYIRYGDP